MRNWIAALLLTTGLFGPASAQEKTYSGTLEDFKAYIAERHPQGWLAPAEIASKLINGVTIRYARWSPVGPDVQGTVVYFSGRTEFIERNTETYSDLAKKGWEVWTFDWRGQGMSDRPAIYGLPVRGAIDDFNTYVDDAKIIVKDIIDIKNKKGKHVLLAHSMGGQIALRYLLDPDNSGEFTAVVLSSPLVRLPNIWVLPDWVLDVSLSAKEVVAKLGWSDEQACRPREDFEWKSAFAKPCDLLRSPTVPEPTSSDLNGRDATTAYKYTHDLGNLALGECLVKETYANPSQPGLAVTCPTVEWILAANRSTHAVLGSLKRDANLLPPVLIVSDVGDQIVNADAAGELCGAIQESSPKSVCKWVQIPGAGHELLIERDNIRDAFLGCFADFVDHPSERGGDLCQDRVNRIPF